MKVRLALAAALMLFVGACAQMNAAFGRGGGSETQQAQAGLSAPELVEGSYMSIPMQDMWCPKCANFPGRWRANAEIVVYAAPRINAPIVDRLSAEEWVNAVRYELHLKALRGVVRRAGRGFEVGDEVYSVLRCWDEELCNELVWRNGRTVEFPEGPDNSAPEIENVTNLDALDPNSRIDWVYVEREGGRRSGWIRDMNLSGVE